MRIDTRNATKRYKVVVIDCWAKPGDERVDPEPAIKCEFDFDEDTRASFALEAFEDGTVTTSATERVV